MSSRVWSELGPDEVDELRLRGLGAARVDGGRLVVDAPIPAGPASGPDPGPGARRGAGCPGRGNLGDTPPLPRLGIPPCRPPRPSRAPSADPEEHRRRRPATLALVDHAGLTRQLHVARTLTSDYGFDACVRALLDAVSVNVASRANPDAPEVGLGSPARECTTRGRLIDDERDGHWGEEPSSDVNDGGVIAGCDCRIRSGPGHYPQSDGTGSSLAEGRAAAVREDAGEPRE